jgi:hypothetical protein
MNKPLYVVTVISYDRQTLMSTFFKREEAEKFVADSTRVNKDPVVGCSATITELMPVRWDDGRLDSENEWMKPVRIT